ncbi:MAG: ferrous iron transport protein B [Ignavibacterium sp.]|nr:ferrous iron transport protein B [Ignavibacterium sp.]
MNSPVLTELPLITLVGPPNSGKTTLFNYLSGKKFKTVNYPGSTVEYSTAKILSKYNLQADLLDSPGIISLNPGSPDEEVSVSSLYNHPKLGSPDLVIVTVDASQITRHLFLAKQLVMSGFKMIIAVTMVDLLHRRNLTVSSKKLSEELGCDVVLIDGRTGKGINDIIDLIKNNIESLSSDGRILPTRTFSDSDKNELLGIYHELEGIENKVLEPLNKKSGDVNLEKANAKLIVLNPTIKEAINKPDEITLRIDKFLLHRIWGLFFFFLIMAATFTSIFWIADPFMGYVDDFFALLAESASEFLGDGWVSNFVADGVITGTGAVLVFLPQILMLFLILGLLEDTGYLARGAMLIDRPLSKIGLNGKSFVPMLSGFACAIPAMMAARTIANRKERLLTIFIIPLMSCSARLPVYALLIAFLIPGDKPWIGGLILATIYIFSIVSSLIAAAIINKYNKSLLKAKDDSSFILELPAYRVPKPLIVIRNSFESAKQYITHAGPVILVFSIVLWFLTYFPNHSPEIPDAQLMDKTELAESITAERLSSSYASILGKVIEPVMTPIGMDWRVGVSLIATFAAREVFVSSMALIFKVTADEESLQSSILTSMRSAKNDKTGELLFTPATIIGLIVFFIFALQCISTLAVSRKETGSWRIPFLQVTLFTVLAYLFTFITVNGLRFLGLP